MTFYFKIEIFHIKMLFNFDVNFISISIFTEQDFDLSYLFHMGKSHMNRARKKLS